MAKLQEMEQMFKEKKYSELLRTCEERIDLVPEDVDALFYYASALQALGRYPAAKKTFAKLFEITKSRLFLVCEAMPEFLGGEREEAIALLMKETEEDNDVENLMFAFNIAVKNGAFEVAKGALRKALSKDSKKTINILQDIFEKSAVKSIEMRQVFAVVITMLRDLEKPK